MTEFKRLSRDLVAHGSIIDYYQDTILVPNGNVVKWDMIVHKGAAAVVPVLSDGRILMVRQYRNALDSYTIEIPAGGLNSTEEPMIEAAARELEEETGYYSESLEFLISIRTTVAFCNERIDIFVAKDLIKTKQKLDEDEFIEFIPYTVDELENMILQGTIQDSKTVSAIMTYKAKYKNQKLS